MSFEKFKILMWKNWIIVKRNWKAALFEILFPILLILFMAWTKSVFDPMFFMMFATMTLPWVFVFSMFYSVNTTIKVSAVIERKM